ncbi:MAG: ABC transporter ATP-binding protein/permease [Prevotellaceae bacterium]|jgi:subfamily B ATP-binding cassette protein MsbA|nr:ABC transporter ATP-binding protein/permease [Prevotellaceae bacterium]
MNKNFSRLLAFAKPYAKFWPRYLLFVIPGTIFSVINYVLLIPLLNVIFDPDQIDTVSHLPEFSLSVSYFVSVFNYYVGGILVSQGPMGALIFVSIAIVLASFIANFCNYMGQRIMSSMGTYVVKNIRESVYDKVSRLSVGYFNDQRKGNLLSSMSNDVTEVQNSVIISFKVLFKDPFVIIATLFGLFYISYQLMLITLIALPISGLLIGRISRRLKRSAKDAQDLQGDILSMTEETISGVRIVKAFNAQKYVRGKFNDLNNKHRGVMKKMLFRQDMASPLSEFLGVTVAAGVLLCGGWFILNGQSDMRVASLVAFLGLYYQILNPVKEITRAYTNVQRGMASANRIFAILDAPLDVKKAANPISIKEFKNEIEFKDVSFHYNTDAQVLKHINFTIEKGKMAALVGHSGSGKSTIADLIPRYYDVTGGEILLDGINIKDYRPKDLIGLMGIVTQEAILFNDTVLNNIAFGSEGVKEEDVIQAAKIANAHEFIVHMDNGYYTNIGDRGGKLSGGQRQRLAIARAVLRNPPILILDEATSALDTESERMVQDALTKLMENRTSIVVAHRLSTIQHADQIIVLQAGEIIERGTHAELMALNGAYKRLCGMQGFS